MKKLLCCSIAAVLVLSDAAACTTMIVTPGASIDGSMIVTHSDDNHLFDQSLVYVPAKDHPAGAMRPVYASAAAIDELPEYNSFFLPRIVDENRAPAYAHPDKPKSKAIGYIPEVAHTYAYIDGNYGIINEHGLMFGECTDGAFVKNYPEPGKRIFYSAELSRVALERAKTAREAITIIGELIENYGYYGTGETLPVADKNEAWVIEMAPSPDGTGGLWVAQKVNDGEYFIAANEFRIRELDPKNPNQIIGKQTIAKIEAAAWRSPADKTQKIDWLSSVSKGEYSHPYYSLRRVWRAMSLVAPSKNLPAWVESGLSKAYPFSIKPDKKLSIDDVKRIHRDNYEGSEFDLTKGVAAGPFGSPLRLNGPDDPTSDVGENTKLKGAWERPISMYYIGYTIIAQYNPNVPAPLASTLWVALNRPAESLFVPLAVGEMPKSYENGDTKRYSADVAFWDYELVSQYAQTKYSYVIKDIEERAAKNEKLSSELVAKTQKDLAALAISDPAKARAQRSAMLNENAQAMRMDWREFFYELVAKYAQGMVSTPAHPAQNLGYDEEWLKNTNYHNGPVKYEKK